MEATMSAYLAMLVYVAVSGPGPISLDRLLTRRLPAGSATPPPEGET